jgi:beta-N-acetylhexosaminidase
MAAVVAAAPTLAGRALDRAEAALALRRAPEAADTAALDAEYAALVGGPAHA